MSRQARIVAPGVAHHVVQRGRDDEDVFFTDHDRRFYLHMLADQCGAFGVSVVGYCLMTNHVHLIAIPRFDTSLAKAIGSTHLRYARYVNRVHDRSGHLWQGRFSSCPLEREHCLAALRYVERNPVRAGLVRAARRFPWSSAAAHHESRDPAGLLDLRVWRGWTRPARWREFVRDPDDLGFVGSIRYRTFAGRPLGSDRFIASLETTLNRRLRPRPIGRPSKKRTSATGSTARRRRR